MTTEHERRSAGAVAFWIRQRARLDERFWDRVVRSGSDECWLWTGGCQTKDRDGNGGYGVFLRHRKTVYAHRRALELTLGRTLTVGELALHHCDNPPCCNPAHLYVGTFSDNMRDAIARDRRAIRLRACTRCGRLHQTRQRMRCPDCRADAVREKRARAYVAWKRRGGLEQVRAARRGVRMTPAAERGTE